MANSAAVVTIAAFTLAELSARDVTLTAREALAVVQSLIAHQRDDEVRAPFGPLRPENIVVRHDGTAASTACAVTPTVFEAAIVLNHLLADAHVPGALRYALSRALHEVAAPPFDSLQDFSATVARFESGDRGDILRALFARASSQPAVDTGAWSAVGLPFAAALLAGCALIGAGEAMHATRSSAGAMFNLTSRSSLPARPLILTPPLTMARLPQRGFDGLSSAARERTRTPRAPHATRRAPHTPRARGTFPSRVLARFEIEFKEL